MKQNHIISIGCLSAIAIPVILYLNLLVFGFFVTKTKDLLSEDLIDYTELIKPEMNHQEVTNLIPSKYKKSDELGQQEPRWMNKEFSKKEIHRVVVYDESPDGKHKAVIYFDETDVVVGIDYMIGSH